jgi:hypothetical protein
MRAFALIASGIGVKEIGQLIKKLELNEQIPADPTMMTRPLLRQPIPEKLAYNFISLFVPSLGGRFGRSSG